MTDADTLLKAVQSYEHKQERGKLKIFLGMAPGVGKTYAMLEAARKKLQEGMSVLVGVVETHARSETAALLEGLEILPRHTLTYREKMFQEFDIDTALRLKPTLILVDELAHTNIPGSRNEKRWQDVLELLDAHIDVYTTLNIQHVESFKDSVQSIVNIKIHETIPDLILERASRIELVDLTPQELLERLHEGKVYTGEMPKVAIDHFFQEDHLTALRELSLRLTADVVDKELHEMFITLQKKKGWTSREKLLVPIDETPQAQKLIRLVSRRAFTLHAPWIALYVDTERPLSTESHAQLTDNLSLARQLGAEVITTKDTSLGAAIQRLSDLREVTEILIAKSPQRALLNQLHRLNVKISILPLVVPPPSKPKTQRALRPYLKDLGWVGTLSLICGYIATQIGYKIADFLFLIIIFSAARFFEKGPLLLATLLCTLVWYFFFIPPYGTLYMGSLEDISVLLLFFLVAFLTGMQIRRTKAREKVLINRELSTQAIYEIVRGIATAPSTSALFENFKNKIISLLKGSCEIAIGQEKLHFNQGFDEKEKAIANWVFLNGKEAGSTTPTLSSARYLHIPLKGFKQTVGVLSYCPHAQALSAEENNFLYTAAQQLAYCIERSFAEVKEREHVFLEKTDKIYNRVLHVIASELTPLLKEIKHALTHFENNPSEALEIIDEATALLNHVKDNATAMEKLSTGFIEFHKSPQDVHRLIHQCSKRVEKHLKKRKIHLELPEKLPPLPFDPSLMEILLTNLLLNAIEYSPDGSTITIEVLCQETTFTLSVADEGAGIPPELINKIFEKFYRAPGSTTTGLGLGLAIASSIASIHQGEIQVHNLLPHGASFLLLLPRLNNSSP